MENNPSSSLAASLVVARFQVAQGVLHVGGISVAELADRFGTPFFAYDARTMRTQAAALSAAVGNFASVYYSIKANPNPDVVRIFVQAGLGVEIASSGEYERARCAGADPAQILFAGPGKRPAEIELVLRRGLGELHLESHEEIAVTARIAAELGRPAPVAIRVNPVATVQGGAMRMGGKPSPFGFDEETLAETVDEVARSPHLHLRGLHLFAGTQILSADVLRAQWTHGLTLASQVARQIGRPLHTIDLGGGLGIPYFEGDPELDLGELARVATDLHDMKHHDPLIREARVIIEPGRFLVGPAGVYVARVLAAKISRGQRFVITDGGMHHHLAASGNLGQIVKRDYPLVAATRMDGTDATPASVVGPLCTPLDTLARKAVLPDVRSGDLIAVLQSGAYGLTASPTAFLSHPVAAELLIDSGQARQVNVGTPSTREC